MGFADLIPGVSSGTIAFLYGIYNELLYSIKVVLTQVPVLILKGKFRTAFKLIPFSFLIPLGIGMVLAVFSFVNVVSYLLETQTLYVWSVFFGLVLGSAVVIRKRMAGWTGKRVALLIGAFVLTLIIVSLPQLPETSSPLLTAASGMIASMAMILPGISGSLMLVLLGQYEGIIAAISNLDILKLGLFALGIVVGLAIFSKLLSWLLHNHHSAVIATLIGVLLGSLGAIWPWQTDGALQAPAFDLSLLVVIALAAVGFAIVFLLERIGIAKEHNEDVEAKEFKKDIATQHE